MCVKEAGMKHITDEHMNET